MPRFLFVLLLAFSTHAVWSQDVQFVFTSDAHYGLNRTDFRGEHNVSAHEVNAALVAKINSLPAVNLPKDGGLRGGKTVGSIDFVVEGGDIANRQEKGIQSATASWAQFQTDYLDGIRLKDSHGKDARVFLVPGNHDVSNAIGYHQTLVPTVDATSLVEIYNRMLQPATQKTIASYSYSRDKVYYSRNLAGVHFVFLTLWPDSQARAWLEKDLRTVPAQTPVILFTHDQPDIETKHLTNPNGSHDINAIDLFENMVVDRASVKTISGTSTKEQQQLTKFLKKHPAITAYFHGNSNWNQFYEWTGTDGSIALHTFRVDSPMKGRFSASDETKLSFHLVTIDSKLRLMTVRECLWNGNPKNPETPITFGGSTTVSLAPRNHAVK